MGTVAKREGGPPQTVSPASVRNNPWGSDAVSQASTRPDLCCADGELSSRPSVPWPRWIRSVCRPSYEFPLF